MIQAGLGGLENLAIWVLTDGRTAGARAGPVFQRAGDNLARIEVTRSLLKGMDWLELGDIGLDIGHWVGKCRGGKTQSEELRETHSW